MTLRLYVWSFLAVSLLFVAVTLPFVHASCIADGYFGCMDDSDCCSSLTCVTNPLSGNFNECCDAANIHLNNAGKTVCCADQPEYNAYYTYVPGVGCEQCAPDSADCTDFGCCDPNEVCSGVYNEWTGKTSTICNCPTVECGGTCCDSGDVCVQVGSNDICEPPTCDMSDQCGTYPNCWSPNWTCTPWQCASTGLKTRTCTNAYNDSSCTLNEPSLWEAVNETPNVRNCLDDNCNGLIDEFPAVQCCNPGTLDHFDGLVCGQVYNVTNQMTPPPGKNCTSDNASALTCIDGTCALPQTDGRGHTSPAACVPDARICSGFTECSITNSYLTSNNSCSIRANYTYYSSILRRAVTASTPVNLLRGAICDLGCDAHQVCTGGEYCRTWGSTWNGTGWERYCSSFANCYDVNDATSCRIDGCTWTTIYGDNSTNTCTGQYCFRWGMQWNGTADVPYCITYLNCSTNFPTQKACDNYRDQGCAWDRVYACSQPNAGRCQSDGGPCLAYPAVVGDGLCAFDESCTSVDCNAQYGNSCNAANCATSLNGPTNGACLGLTATAYTLNWTPSQTAYNGSDIQFLRMGPNELAVEEGIQAQCLVYNNSVPLGVASYPVTGLQPNTVYWNRVGQFCTNLNGSVSWRNWTWNCTTAAASSANLSGYVWDGVPGVCSVGVRGATVSLVAPPQGYLAATSGNCHYQITGIPAGTHSVISAEQAGYRSVTMNGISFSAGQTVNLNFTLTNGSCSGCEDWEGRCSVACSGAPLCNASVNPVCNGVLPNEWVPLNATAYVWCCQSNTSTGSQVTKPRLSGAVSASGCMHDLVMFTRILSYMGEPVTLKVYTWKPCT